MNVVSQLKYSVAPKHAAIGSCLFKLNITAFRNYVANYSCYKIYQISQAEYFAIYDATMHNNALIAMVIANLVNQLCRVATSN